MPVVLNVGGGTKKIPIPAHFNGWRHDLLDIDPAVSPDICMDARELTTLPAAWADAVYCSHNLEHYYPHDAAKVVDGFAHVVKDDGFVELRLPDLAAVMRFVVQNNLDPDSQLYVSGAGPVLVRDVIYGYNPIIKEQGSDFFAHKNGYSASSLRRLFSGRGFVVNAIATHGFDLYAYFFKQRPRMEIQKLLGIEIPADFPIDPESR
jgi:predicted SAM-dependent methyltransferase